MQKIEYHVTKEPQERQKIVDAILNDEFVQTSTHSKTTDVLSTLDFSHKKPIYTYKTRYQYRYFFIYPEYTKEEAKAIAEKRLALLETYLHPENYNQKDPDNVPDDLIAHPNSLNQIENWQPFEDGLLIIYSVEDQLNLQNKLIDPNIKTSQIDLWHTNVQCPASKSIKPKIALAQVYSVLNIEQKTDKNRITVPNADFQKISQKLTNHSDCAYLGNSYRNGALYFGQFRNQYDLNMSTTNKKDQQSHRYVKAISHIIDKASYDSQQIRTFNDWFNPNKNPFIHLSLEHSNEYAKRFGQTDQPIIENYQSTPIQFAKPTIKEYPQNFETLLKQTDLRGNKQLPLFKLKNKYYGITTDGIMEYH